MVRFVYVNPGPRFMSALVIVESPSYVIPLLDCLDPLHCVVDKVSFCTIAICQNVDHLSVPSYLYASYLRFS